MHVKAIVFFKPMAQMEPLLGREDDDGSVAAAEAEPVLCGQCNSRPAAVLRGNMSICGPCYYADSVMQRHSGSRRRNSEDVLRVIDAVQQVERNIWLALLGGCSCPPEE